MQASSMAEALAFFRNQLARNGDAKAYCERRGLDEEVMQLWELGFAPEEGSALATQLRSGLAKIEGIELLDRGRELCAIVTFTHPAHDADVLHAELEARGINSSVSSRTSAQYDFEEKGVEAALRLSPHYYNTEEEVEEVVAALAELTNGRRRAF